ncbi:hypothetical protein P9112_010219 [Eukaryota sp. TZLM1-RC]
MRMRCYLWPCNLPNDLFCKCGAGLTLSHLFNCNRFISYRSTLHDAVRDQIHAMCNSYHIESFVEPLLRSLDINESARDSEYGKRRADVVVPSFDDVMNVSGLSPLDDSKLYKRKKYANPLKELKHVRHVDYQIRPFAISLYGRLGKTAMNFIDDFENLVKRRMNKRFDRRLWLNRIVFTIFKSIPKMISKALMSVSAHYEEIAVVRFDAAFIGGGKNFVFEFSRRYPFAENLLETTNSLFLDNLREEISSLSPDLWQSCFPISIQEIPDRSLYSLKFALKKLQRHLLRKFESKDFIVRLSTAKKENPAFANFLIDLKDSSSAVLINQIPQIFVLFLNDDQWTTAMRMRCYLWPCNLPNDLFCKCGAGLTLSHLFNCNRFISYRSTLHDAVRDQIHAMCNSYHIESFVEPLLRSLDINESVRDSEYGKRRADVVVPSFDDVMNVVDVVTVDVCKKNALKNAQSEVSPLDDSELYKRKKYANPLKELKHVRHVDYQIRPFAISLYGRLGKTAMNFIDDFENLVKRRMNKRFDRRLWLNRIVFTIFKSIPKMISKALMSVSAHYEEIAVVRFDGVEACFEDIDF